MKLIEIKVLIILISAMLAAPFAHAFDLDETVNDEIRRNYNANKLVEDAGINLEEGIDENLPDLPNITKKEQIQQKNQPDIKTTANQVPSSIPIANHSAGDIAIRKGTVFKVVNTGAISDWQQKGTVVKFKSNTNINGKKYTIPSGTIFTGEIVESHQPQITCNGGLVAIRIYSMLYKGQTVPLSAYVIRANDRKVFFNDIKGDRTYLKTMWKKGNWGRSLFNKMWTLTVNLGSKNSTLVLSPFPIAYGTICLGANTLVSPITAFFSKGGHVSIPAGSKFALKLNEPAYID